MSGWPPGILRTFEPLGTQLVSSSSWQVQQKHACLVVISPKASAWSSLPNF